MMDVTWDNHLRTITFYDRLGAVSGAGTCSVCERLVGTGDVLVTAHAEKRRDRKEVEVEMVRRVEVLLAYGLELVSITDRSAHLRRNGLNLYRIVNKGERGVAPKYDPNGEIIVAGQTLYVWSKGMPWYDGDVEVKEMRRG